MKPSIKDYTSSTRLIIKEALRRGIKVDFVYPRHCVKFIYKNHIEYLYRQFASCTTSVGLTICNKKMSTKYFLKKAGISTSQGELFNKNDFDKAKKFVKKIGFPVVAKPEYGTHGDFVFADIENFKELKDAWNQIHNIERNVVIEKKFFGKDYRIFATKNKMVGIIQRVPANVTGDSKHTIEQLINLKNKDPRRTENSTDLTDKALVKIKIDSVVKNYLKKQKLSLKSVLPQGKQIFLRPNANLSTGGDSIDYTDIAHKSVKEIAVKIINALPGLAYGGIDFMTKDISQKQTNKTYAILEVNASPGIDMHHLPYKGKIRDAAGAIIDMIFPETK